MESPLHVARLVVGAIPEPAWSQFERAFETLTSVWLLVLALVLLFLVRQRRSLVFAGLMAAVSCLLLGLAVQRLLNAAFPNLLSPPVALVLSVLVALLATGAAVTLLRLVPQVLQLPLREELARRNNELDERVRERTLELTASNERLAAEIHHRERAEAEVRRLYASLEHRVTELQTLFEFIPIGVGISKDVHCTHIQMNPALAIILGLPPAHASLMALPMAGHANFTLRRRGQELPPHQHPMRVAAMENQAVLDYEISVERGDGSHLDVAVSAVPLRDRTGHARGCVATFQDITQRKRSERERLDFERQLQETQKLESLGVLSGGIAHDFNNLLTGVLGHANLARFALPPGQQPVEQALDQIEKSAQRAADLCKQLLAYAGKGRFNVEPLNLSQLVEDMSHLLFLSLTQRARLELQLTQPLPLMLGDVTQLRQVVMNLVINAAEAMPAGRTGLIRLQTTIVDGTMEAPAGRGNEGSESQWIQLEITDDGTGMDADTQAKIFDPFFTTKFTGRGLGLAAVQGIVRSHQGGIRVSSSPGAGTTFQLRFPIAPGAVLPTPPEPVARSDWRGSGRALVIDDEETVRHVAQRVLEKLGFTVVSAHDGVDGLEKFRASGPFRLVLLDLTMPRLDGERTWREIHQEDPRVPVLLMSGFNEQLAVERFVGEGLAGFVPKPFTVELLTRKVRQALEKSADRA